MRKTIQGVLRDRLGHNVARLRRLHGWSLIELAHECGLSRSYVNEIELCRRNVGIDNIDRLAKSFKIDPIELLLPAVKAAAPGDQA